MFFYSLGLETEINLDASPKEEKDLGCITLLTIASEKSKNNGEIDKYEKLKKLKKLKKSFQANYKDEHFSDEIIILELDKQNLKILEKGQRYINKGLQKCWLK